MESGAAGRDSFAAYKDLLREYDFRPSRRLGQNFLLDPSLHRVLVDSVAPRPDDIVLEVGAGLGFLTRELAPRCRVVAVEVDDRLVQVLRRELASFPGGGSSVRLVAADVLLRSRLNPEIMEVLREERAGQPATGRFLLIANLPYAIAGPLLAELTAIDDPPVEMAVLVQLELAQRLAASHDTREYGALTAQMQLAYETRFLRKVSAQAFRPRPRVDSAMIRLTRRPEGTLLRPAAERRAMAVFLRQLFASRRKKLRNAKVLSDPELRDLPGWDAADLDRRPDAVSPAGLLRLFEAARDRLGPGGEIP